MNPLRPFSNLDETVIERKTFAFLCHFLKYKWVTWDNMKMAFADYKKYYYGEQQPWIVSPIKFETLNRMNTKNIIERRQYAMCHMLHLLQERANSPVNYWTDNRIASQLNRYFGMLYYSLNCEEFSGRVKEIQNKFLEESKAVMDDVTYTYIPPIVIPKLIQNISKVILKEEKIDELYGLSDACEDHDMMAEAEHFRQGLHTWCCPILRKLAGK